VRQVGILIELNFRHVPQLYTNKFKRMSPVQHNHGTVA
jgi:hypothetical protein